MKYTTNVSFVSRTPMHLVVAAPTGCSSGRAS